MLLWLSWPPSPWPPLRFSVSLLCSDLSVSFCFSSVVFSLSVLDLVSLSCDSEPCSVFLWALCWCSSPRVSSPVGSPDGRDPPAPAEVLPAASKQREVTVTPPSLPGLEAARPAVGQLPPAQPRRCQKGKETPLRGRWKGGTKGATGSPPRRSPTRRRGPTAEEPRRTQRPGQSPPRRRASAAPASLLPPPRRCREPTPTAPPQRAHPGAPRPRPSPPAPPAPPPRPLRPQAPPPLPSGAAGAAGPPWPPPSGASARAAAQSAKSSRSSRSAMAAERNGAHRHPPGRPLPLPVRQGPLPGGDPARGGGGPPAGAEGAWLQGGGVASWEVGRG